MAKTERIYATAPFDGEADETALKSISTAMEMLAIRADIHERDLLWDTLDIGIDRSEVDDRTFDQVTAGRIQVTTVEVSALGVKR